VINSIIAGALMGVLASWLLLWTVPLCALAGGVVFGVSEILHARWALSGWARFGLTTRPLFPTPRDLIRGPRRLIEPGPNRR